MTQRTNKTTNDLMASTAVQESSKNDMKKEDVALTPAQEKELEVCAERLGALGRKSTEQAFAYGEELARAQAILPAKKFGKWLTANSGIGTKTAKNYTRVYKELAPYRDRLVKAAVAPSVMFALLAADDTAIETVLGAFENGDRPTVETIKEMLAPSSDEPTFETLPMNTGGLKGFLKAVELRTMREGARFTELTRSILVIVEEAAVQIANKKTVRKGELSAAIQHDARHANDFLKIMLAPVVGEKMPSFHHWEPGKLVPDSAWGRAQAVLEKLGDYDVWPDMKYFKSWLTDEVLPVLRFIVNGDELPGFEAKRLIERPTSAEHVDGDDAENAELIDYGIVKIDVERRKRQGPNTEAA